MSRELSKLLFAASESNADLLYFGRFFAPDPFIAFEHERRRYAVLNALEIARGRSESIFDEVLSLEEWKEKAKQLFQKKNPGIVEIVATVARKFGMKGIQVGGDFPLGLARKLEGLGLQLTIAEEGLFPERERKNQEEAEAIRRGNLCSAAGIRAAELLLRKAQVKQGKLFHEKRFLTSERLKEEIEIACLRAGALSSHTIAAGGDQACDPHCTGSGVLRANELIIIDVFPRVVQTGYFGDMTRTFLKGKASEAQKRLVETVRSAQQQALGQVKAGVAGNTIHRGVVQFFADAGYETKTRDGRPEGFFHGTGHGLGLEVHEAPRLSAGGPRLKVGQVVTVEPGLYYPGLGAARIEDVVWVRAEGGELLSKYPYRWQLP
jgi:Xaa-Pro aminopeptidase